MGNKAKRAAPLNVIDIPVYGVSSSFCTLFLLKTNRLLFYALFRWKFGKITYIWLGAVEWILLTRSWPSLLLQVVNIKKDRKSLTNPSKLLKQKTLSAASCNVHAM